MTEFLTRLADLFGAGRYAAHSICLSSDFVVVNLYVLSDLSIAGSYFVIGAILMWLSRSSPNTIYLLFGAFIFGCGLTHLTMTLTLFYGVYYLDLLTRGLTAGISVATALIVLSSVLKGSTIRSIVRDA